jgi:hypothetical protein
MKRRTILFAVIIVSMTGHAQQQQTKNLSMLAKVWGFLKYYHPAAAKGTPDWDKELIRMIPLAKQAPSDDDFYQLITNWYLSLPPAAVAKTVTQPKSDSVARIFDEQDIANFGLPKAMLDEMMKLYLYHIPDSSKYISDHYNEYHLDYIRHIEEPFNQPSFPDEEHRLLALFRYWNVIEYFYPYKKINAADWNSVLPAFIPKFIATGDSTGYRETFLALTARLKDSHSFFSHPVWNRLHNRMAMPFEVTYIDGKYYIGATNYDSVMHSFGFQIGDEIVGINNQTITERVNDLRPLTTGTNELSFYRNIAFSLFRIDTNRTMRVSIRRKEKLIEKTVRLFTGRELSALKKDALPLWQNMGNDIWLVRFCNVPTVDTLRKLFADLQAAKMVIWDMRGYPQFPVVQAMGPGVYQSPFSSTISYNGILGYPGSMTKRVSESYAVATSSPLTLYKGPMIVLVDERTQSLSESVAYELSFRPNTIVMGRQTAGTTGNITWIECPGGIAASFTGVGVEGLNGRFKEGMGVKIDKEIQLSAKNLLSYPDYMLEMAYREAMKR